MMSLEYLKFNIFQMAVTDMAESTGSLPMRVSKAYAGYFYKLDWDRDVLSIPEEHRENFMKLKALLDEGLIQDILQQRKIFTESYGETTQISNIINARSVLANMHWRKAKLIASLIMDTFNDLRVVYEDQLRRAS